MNGAEAHHLYRVAFACVFWQVLVGRRGGGVEDYGVIPVESAPSADLGCSSN